MEDTLEFAKEDDLIDFKARFCVLIETLTGHDKFFMRDSATERKKKKNDNKAFQYLKIYLV